MKERTSERMDEGRKERANEWLPRPQSLAIAYFWDILVYLNEWMNEWMNCLAEAGRFLNDAVMSLKQAFFLTEPRRGEEICEQWVKCPRIIIQLY